MEVMLGTGDGSMATETVRLGKELPKNGKRQDFMRAKLSQDKDGQICATPLPVQDSSMMKIFAEANCLLIRSPYAPPARAGEPVSILRLDAAVQRF